MKAFKSAFRRTVPHGRGWSRALYSVRALVVVLRVDRPMYL